MKRAALGSSAVAMMALLLVSQAPAVAAHTELILSSPSDGEALASAPTEVVLTFSEELLPDTVKVAVTDDQETVVTSAVALADGLDVIVAWPAGLPGGTYFVNYRVVSQDGHPVSGSISFSYPGAASASATPPATAPSATPVATQPPGESAGTGLALNPVLLVAVGLLIGLAIGIGIAVRARRSSGPAS